VLDPGRANRGGMSRVIIRVGIVAGGDTGLNNIHRPLMDKKWSFIPIGLIISCFPETGETQQNLFNVPTSDITEKGKVFFQEQMNVVSLRGTSYTTFTYGLGNNFEMGMNVFNVATHPSHRHSQNPSFLINSQKGFNISDTHKISIGTQTGLAPPLYNGTSVQISSFSYINSAMDLKKWGKYYVGGYYADRAYAGRSNSVGLMAGMEYEFLRNKVHLIGDLLTGHNNISTAVLGAMFYLPGKWHISMGAQIPIPHSHGRNNYGLVFQLTHE
jgi:hypothetical protein